MEDIGGFMSKKNLFISMGISLGVGGLSSLLTYKSQNIYDEIITPTLSPPSILFPIVWTVLYILMGISSYIVYNSQSEFKSKALVIYVLQLIVNFIWPILFFNLRVFLLSFLWLILLVILVIYMLKLFYDVKPISSYLQIPYICWLLFASYLNFMIYVLNS